MKKHIYKFKEKAKHSLIGEKVLLPLYRTLPIITRKSLSRATDNPYSSLEDSEKIIFIHVPKNAGNGIIRSLYGCEATGHNTALSYKKADSVKFEDYFKFGVCRNPWDRVVSAYHYLKQGGMGFLDKEFEKKCLHQFESFEQFIYFLRSKQGLKLMRWTHFMPQSDFLCIEDEIAVDLLLRFESLERDFNTLCTHLNISNSLTVSNSSKRTHYKDYYDEKTAALIGEIYKKDVDIFKYDF